MRAKHTGISSRHWIGMEMMLENKNCRNDISVSRTRDKVWKWSSIDSICAISSPNPMFHHVLESYWWDDSNKWSNIGFGEEISIIEINIPALSGAIWEYTKCFLCYISTNPYGVTLIGLVFHGKTTHCNRLGETIPMKVTPKGLVQKWESYLLIVLFACS